MDLRPTVEDVLAFGINWRSISTDSIQSLISRGERLEYAKDLLPKLDGGNGIQLAE